LTIMDDATKAAKRAEIEAKVAAIQAEQKRQEVCRDDDTEIDNERLELHVAGDDNESDTA